MHDKELAAGGIRVHRAGHGNNAWLMFQFIFETILIEFTFDGVAWATHAVAIWAAALNHKTGNNPMEGQIGVEAFVHQRDKVIYRIWGNLRI